MPMKLVFPATDDLWDEENSRFVSKKEQTLVLEHSLKSVSKWEQKWKKPFLATSEKTPQEWLSYVKCMTINNVDDSIYNRLTTQDFEKIFHYIGDPMTATTITDHTANSAKKEVVTSEILYYNMFSYGIPIELEKWHLNTLITLIHVFSIKNGGSKKMSRAEAAAYQRSINESRRNKRRR